MWDCRGGSYPMPDETVTEAIEQLFAEVDRLQLALERAREAETLGCIEEVFGASHVPGFGPVARVRASEILRTRLRRHRGER